MSAVMHITVKLLPFWRMLFSIKKFNGYLCVDLWKKTVCPTLMSHIYFQQFIISRHPYRGNTNHFLNKLIVKTVKVEHSTLALRNCFLKQLPLCVRTISWHWALKSLAISKYSKYIGHFKMWGLNMPETCKSTEQ